jgi:large subunit ribosomal protein L5
MKYTPSLMLKYRSEIIPALTEKFSYTSVMQVPRIIKIVVNSGVGDAVADKKLIEIAQEEISNITGQKAMQTYSTKDVSNFKLRKGMPIGIKVTLRREKMYEFMERLINVALPRLRDFNGVSSKFDGKGNYTLGIAEQIIFPEIDIDKINKIMGLEITFVTSARTDEEGFALLKEFGIPFKK